MYLTESIGLLNIQVCHFLHYGYHESDIACCPDEKPMFWSTQNRACKVRGTNFKHNNRMKVIVRKLGGAKINE
jgi:hypothetical protein